MSIETTGTRQFTFLRPFATPVSPARSTLLRKLGLFQHARHLLVRFLLPTCPREKNLSVAKRFAGDMYP